jgi:sterol desaturase/sphingolipid hydroxylase (fatty acid hydroxylase superfamily)
MTIVDTLVSIYQAADAKQLFLVGMVPIFALTIILEFWHFRKTNVYNLKDSLASIVLGNSYVVAEAITYGLIFYHVMEWVYGFRLMDISINAWTFVILFVLADLSFYVYHRTSHRVRWFWATHVVHHASEHMNFTTAARQSTLYPFGGVFLFFLPLNILGFAVEWVLFALALNLAYQWFLHTQWIRKLPRPIEFIFNTPSHHRVHHGRNDEYIDRNFGGTLIIWDRLFGTFVEERDDLPPEYGITRQVYSFNPIWLTLHEWFDLVRDMTKPGPLQERLKHLWKPPEWERPDFESKRVNQVASQHTDQQTN